ncbi:MAG: DegT/DnrJ/EryC1/StrS family aminotransferase [Candidatus Colwellbacteria bacterium]|nr:DegT/DnrJ/EryC1/StrS family aminotransferase [Candidatus Colwellbacteria bacterium]
MKPIFNSLGSNYSFGFALKAVGSLFMPNIGAQSALRQELGKRFGGEALLVYKGRDAIQCALEGFGIGQGDVVLTQAFTCCAIEEAILRTGAVPLFVDVEKGGLNLSVGGLRTAYAEAKHPKAVIVQNTLGVPADIEGIRRWCDENKLLLIEDLAQSVGAVSREGKALGLYGDVVVLSFGRDKVIDAVSGGAVIFRQPASRKPKVNGKVGVGIIIKDMVYPILTWKIRKTHNFLLGKVILRMFRDVGLMTSAVASSTKTAAPMPAPYARLALRQLRNLDRELTHRREISKAYLDYLDSKAVGILINPSVVRNGANLRLPLWTENPDELLKYLKRKSIYLADRWYRSPVDCGRLSVKGTYKCGSCSNAEKLSEKIINLPTHTNVEKGDAIRIAKAINHYLK